MDPREALASVHEERATAIFLALLFMTVKNRNNLNFHNNGMSEQSVGLGQVFKPGVCGFA
jgi:hypothetical protein